MSIYCLLGFKTEEEREQYNKKEYNSIIPINTEEAINTYCFSASAFRVEYKDGLNIQDYTTQKEIELIEKRTNKFFLPFENEKRMEFDKQIQEEKQQLLEEKNNFIKTFNDNKIKEITNKINDDIIYFLILKDIESIDEYKNLECLIDYMEVK
jgi:hypothetical protein